MSIVILTDSPCCNGIYFHIQSYLFSNQNVGAFDVSVDDPFAMQVPRSEQNLVHEPPDQVFSEHSELLQHACDGSTRDILEKDVQVPRASVGAAVANYVSASNRAKVAPRITQDRVRGAGEGLQARSKLDFVEVQASCPNLG